MRFWNALASAWPHANNLHNRCRQITTPTPHHSTFTGRMLFQTPNQQCQSKHWRHSPSAPSEERDAEWHVLGRSGISWTISKQSASRSRHTHTLSQNSKKTQMTAAETEDRGRQTVPWWRGSPSNRPSEPTPSPAYHTSAPPSRTPCSRLPTCNSQWANSFLMAHRQIISGVPCWGWGEGGTDPSKFSWPQIVARPQI